MSAVKKLMAVLRIAQTLMVHILAVVKLAIVSALMDTHAMVMT